MKQSSVLLCGSLLQKQETDRVHVTNGREKEYGMGYERIMGLNVIDDTEYQKYRDTMIPILTTYGGAFGFDFKVSEVLKSKTDDPINRVFTIDFPDEATMNAFFNDPGYLDAKAKHLDHSVNARTIISLHEK